MRMTELLTRLAALSDDEDVLGWPAALATDVHARGLAGDDDQSATMEACQHTRDVVAELRQLAKAARDLQQSEERRLAAKLGLQAWTPETLAAHALQRIDELEAAARRGAPEP